MMPHVEEMNEKDQEEGDVPGGSNDGDVLGGSNDGDKNKKNEKQENEKKENKKMCDTKEDAGDDDGGEDVGGGEGGGGGDYVIGGDGVAVLHGVQMVPFHMNMPALLGWEKGGSDTRKSITGTSHPGEGVSVVGKSSEPRKVEKEAKKWVVVLLTKVLHLVARRRLVQLQPRTHLLCPWDMFHFLEVCNFRMMQMSENSFLHYCK